MEPHSHPSEKPHPSPLNYIVIGVILTVITAIEVWAFYWDVPMPLLVTFFIVLSIVKFAIVVLFYMHLRYDHKLFGSMFTGGLLLGVGVALGLIALFGNFFVGDRETAHAPEPTFTPTIIAPRETPTGTQTPGGGTPRPVTGEGVFIAKGCGGCHTIQGLSGAVGQVGPNLTNIGTVAATRKPGLSAEQYMRESIEQPGAFVVSGFAPVMPALRGTMSEAEYQALVNYLVSLK